MIVPSGEAGVSADFSASLMIRLLASLVLTATILPASWYLRKDYLAFVSLGPGGTPCNFQGYLRVKALSLFALRNPYEPAPVPDGAQHSKGHLVSLPTRNHARPKTRGIAPHRQVTQRSDEKIYSKLAEAIENLARHGGDRLEIGTSCFEKHGTGLFSTSPAKRTCRGEICHAHPSDGSMHLTLHPMDAKVVLEAGWGERHPISRGGIFEKFVPKGFLMIYAPQNEKEVGIVMEIVKAAAWFVGGEDVPGQWNETDGLAAENNKQAECSWSMGELMN